MQRIVWTFGLIAGGILSLTMIVSMYFIEQIGMDHSEIIGYTTMVLAFLLVFFGVRAYRDTVGGGRITFWRAVAVGLLITAVASTCYVITWEFIYHLFLPDFAEQYAARVMERARAAGATPAQLARQAQKMADFQTMYRNPLLNVAMTFVEPLPVGLLVAFISAAILRTRRAPNKLTVPAQVTVQ